MKAPAIAPTTLDRLIGFFDPQAAVSRLRARAQFAAVAAFTGADMNRRGLRAWFTSRGSADADVVPNLDKLRTNSRDLVRNVPIATGAIATSVTSVVGTGMSMQSAVDAEALGWTEEQAAQWQKTTEREWRLWAESTDCDITRHADIYGLQELAFRSALENGDSIALLPFVSRAGSAYDLRVQLVEADRLANKDNGQDSKTLVAGVELDAYGAPKAYHICRSHPQELSLTGLTPEWDVVPAFGASTGRRNVLHLYKRSRIGQNRGVPFLSPVIEIVKQLGRYTDAEVMAAVTAGMLTVFVTSEGGVGLNTAIPGLASETGAKAGDEDIKLGYGSIVDLKPGEDISSVSPGRPNPNFDPFFQANVRQIGLALEIPFEILIKHFTASYSAARAAMVEFYKFVRSRRAWLVQQFCQPIYEAWLEEAVAAGRIVAPGFFDQPALRRAYCGATWHGDAMPQVDPVKEVEAAKGRIELGVSDRARETAELTGGDWETTHRRQVREKKMRDADGMAAVAAPASALAPARPNGPEDSGDSDREDRPSTPAPAPRGGKDIPPNASARPALAPSTGKK